MHGPAHTGTRCLRAFGGCKAGGTCRAAGRAFLWPGTHAQYRPLHAPPSCSRWPDRLPAIPPADLTRCAGLLSCSRGLLARARNGASGSRTGRGPTARTVLGGCLRACVCHCRWESSVRLVRRPSAVGTSKGGPGLESSNGIPDPVQLQKRTEGGLMCGLTADLGPCVLAGGRAAAAAEGGPSHRRQLAAATAT